MTQDAEQELSGKGKRRPLHRLFNQVTPQYDLLNRLFTFGLDQRWRRRVAKLCTSAGSARVLDICCGTADLALLIAKEARTALEVVAVDFSEAMIAVAADKTADQGFSDRISLVLADASELPFPDEHFDAIGIAFGYRNLTFQNPNTSDYLMEIRRVLAPTGRFVIVETSQPRDRLLRAAFHLYMRIWVGPLGGMLSRRWGAYRYLAESACRFPPPDEVAGLLKAAGFSRVDHKPLLGGITGIHIAWR